MLRNVSALSAVNEFVSREFFARFFDFRFTQSDFIAAKYGKLPCHKVRAMNDDDKFVAPRPGQGGREPGVVEICYYGGIGIPNPAHKAIEALELVEKDVLPRIRLHYAGFSADAMKGYLGKSVGLADKYKANLRFYEYMPWEEISELLDAMDFSLLIRPVCSATIAGFSNKLSECFSRGIPMLATNTGEMRYYLKDGITGIVIESCDLEDIAEAFTRAALLPKEDLTGMREEAYKCAKENFTVAAQEEGLSEFLRGQL
jgi:glycosyltransferase involved in cell wall biosynthesis